MIYLIAQLAPWLLLTALFAALACWMFAAQRAAPAEAAAQREREHLLRDLVRFTGDGPSDPEVDLDAAPTQRLLEIRDGRIAELERALETARGRSDELASELAVLQRGGQLNDLDVEELTRLRAAEAERARTVDAEVSGIEDERMALQEWRLRYFEQRVKYLEGAARAALDAPSQTPPSVAEDEQPPHLEWAAREASARAAFLEDALRSARAPAEVVADPVEVEAEPFASDADVDMLLRWRMLYLERRVAHLQAQEPAVVEAPPPAVEAGHDPDRWKWRARYLEARVRHLEQRPVQVVAQAAPAPEPDVEPTPVRVAAPTASRRAKPPVLQAARNGAPDDLTLIESVSLLQQATFYSLGIFHFDQIAAWSEENIAWVDQYLRLQGRIGEEEWIEQAADLAREGPAAARRVLESEES
jgi:predicted flap endonuclease-1-like 5' DNA nuclease